MKKIYLIGLGPGEKNGLTLRAWDLLKNVQPLFIHDSTCSLVQELEREGVKPEFLDHYIMNGDISKISVEICKRVLDAAESKGKAAFAVPGNPLEDNDTVRLIIDSVKKKNDWEVEIVPGISPQEDLNSTGFNKKKEWDDLEKALTLLVESMAKLRGPEGCPWDRKQSHKSLKPYLIEEAYEAVHAIDQSDMEGLCEELGDIFLQIVFHSQLAHERGEFSLQDVIQKINEKITRRHPHVFGQEIIKDAEAVSLKWSEIKLKEKNKKNLFSMPVGLPALKRAQKIQQQAARHGFDWNNVEGAWLKIKEELKELESVYNTGHRDKIEEEIGDLIFAIVNVSRFLKIDAELALGATAEKFLRRLDYIEQKVKEEGKDFKDYNLEQLDIFWEKAKNKGL